MREEGATFDGERAEAGRPTWRGREDDRGTTCGHMAGEICRARRSCRCTQASSSSMTGAGVETDCDAGGGVNSRSAAAPTASSRRWTVGFSGAAAAAAGTRTVDSLASVCEGGPGMSVNRVRWADSSTFALLRRRLNSLSLSASDTEVVIVWNAREKCQRKRAQYQVQS